MKKKAVYPSKTTLNLVMKERSANYFPKLISGVVIFAVILLVFLKFAVIDRLSAANIAWDDVNSAQITYDELLKENADYEAIRAGYEKYFSGGENVTAEYIDCMDVISLIENKLIASAGVSSVKLSNNTLSVVLNGITLDTLSTIYQSLYESPLVSSVTVSTAVAQDSAESTVSMTIALKAQEETTT